MPAWWLLPKITVKGLSDMASCKEISCALLAEAEHKTESADNTLIYIDNYTIRTLRRPSRHDFHEFTALNRGQAPGYGRAKCGGYNITVRQPTLAAVEHMAERWPNAVIARLDIALDFIFSCPERADDMKKYLDQTTRMMWRGSRRKTEYRGTTYSAKAWQGRNLVTYSDLFSKVSDGYAAHIEFRFYGVQQLRRIGQICLRDVLAMNMHDIIARYVRLSTLNVGKLDRHIEKMAVEYVRRPKKYVFRSKKDVRRPGHDGIMPKNVPSIKKKIENSLIRLLCGDELPQSLSELRSLRNVQDLCDTATDTVPWRPLLDGVWVDIPFTPLLKNAKHVYPLPESRPLSRGARSPHARPPL